MRSPISTAIFISIQHTPHGSAARTHLAGIANGFKTKEIETQLVVNDSGRDIQDSHYSHKVVGILRTLFFSSTCLLRNRSKAALIYARVHPLGFVVAALGRSLGFKVNSELNGPPGEDFVAVWPRFRALTPLIRMAEWWQLRLSNSVI